MLRFVLKPDSSHQFAEYRPVKNSMRYVLYKSNLLFQETKIRHKSFSSNLIAD